MAREAGSRTKMSVWSADENIDPIGACIGPKGQRVAAVVDALNGEKIDIIKFSENPTEYIAAALAPADVLDVDGRRRQGLPRHRAGRPAFPGHRQRRPECRLAARLTGYKIDIKPESFHDEETETVTLGDVASIVIEDEDGADTVHEEA